MPRPALAALLLLAACSGGSSSGPPAAFLVAELLPADGDTAAPVDSPVVVRFSAAADPTTLTVQPALGPCQATSLQVSWDGFATCLGGALTWPAAERAELRAPRLLVEGRTYRARVTAAARSADGRALATPFAQAVGFTAGSPPCTVPGDLSQSSATGAACVEPLFVDNGDGTVTDRANKLLWLRCSLGKTGMVLDAPGGGCATTAMPDDLWSWEDALRACDDLVYAGRDDWTVPDLARLRTLLAASGDPAIDPAFFPASSDLWYTARTSHASQPRSAWSVIFGYQGFTGPGYGGKLVKGRFARCVAGAATPVAPALSPLTLESVLPDSATFQLPTFLTAPSPVPEKVAWLGLTGTIAVTGTTVTGALRLPETLPSVGSGWQLTGLTPGTGYTLVVVAQNAAGADVQQLQFSTGAVAPILRPIGLVGSAEGVDGTVTLLPVSFYTAGNPLPTVEAWIGLDGVIQVSGTTVTGALQGPVTPSTETETVFSGLAIGEYHRVIVVARNSAGSSVMQQIAVTGRWQLGPDGTVLDTVTRLTWTRCPYGQDWIETPGYCAGAMPIVRFCNELDNDCNGGIDTGLLGPPFLAANDCSICSLPGESTAWWGCENAGGAGLRWRVPTVAEVSTITGTDPALFVVPNFFSEYITANSATSETSLLVTAGSGEVRPASKWDPAVLRCVATAP